jgi:hypothetical protein
MEIPIVLPSTLPSFSTLHISILVSKPILIGVLSIFFILYSIVSGVLLYHWSAYGMRSPGIVVAESFFFFISIVLFVFAGLSIYYY